MKIYCSYNKQFHNFLNDVVKLMLDTYASELKIDTLEEIELVNKNQYKIATDGRIISNSRIVVTSRLYERLPILDIDKLEGNEYYKNIKQTLYHEMGHINDMFYMPNLYSYALSDDCNKEQIAAQFWIEYIVEKRSVGFEGICEAVFCNNFIKKKWKCTVNSNVDNFNDNNFAFLTKYMPYFIARANHDNMREKYLSSMKNSLLRDYVNEVNNELERLEKIGLFDDIRILNKLYDVINSNYQNFMSAFRKC